VRVLLVSNDPIGRRMAGPGVRYYHFAQELARRFRVTLVVPSTPDLELAEVEVVEAPRLASGRFLRLARGHDAVVAQQLSVWTMRALARTDVKVVYDLYDPLVVENLPLFAERPAGPARESAFRSVAASQLLALAAGDAFLCASERQRDLWLGALAALGRLDVASYAADPTLRSLVQVVPFGLEADPPGAGAPALKGVVPGIGEEDRVLLWGGGIWSWFDPLTVIRAVGLLSREREDVKLFFLGTRHPKAAVGTMTMAERASALARELGLEGRHVFFNDGWVDYAERGRFLAESDVGVSAHFDDVETRFAFRTRLLDYFWAGLPTVTTGGDVLGELVRERGLGRAVDACDPAAFADAVGGLLSDEAEYRRARQNLAGVREELSWPVVVAALADVVASPARPAPAPRVTLRTLEASALAVGSAVRREGVRGTIDLVLETLRRPRVP
jgi:glycosyltransferase involved in cell wall biosynthesis